MRLPLLNYLLFFNKHHLFGLGKSPTGKEKKNNDTLNRKESITFSLTIDPGNFLNLGMLIQKHSL